MAVEFQSEADDFSYFKSMKNLKGLILNIHRLTE